MHIGICGHYGGGNLFLDGQTVKTKIITLEIKRLYGDDCVKCADTYGGKKKIFSHMSNIVELLEECDSVIILPAQNGLLFFAPLIVLLNIFYRKKLHYVVIGGWLPKYIDEKKWLKRFLLRFDYIYVETNTMFRKLKECGFNNIVFMSNCKQLVSVNKSELIQEYTEPYALCTFARVTKQKGIEDAIKAVIAVNEKYGRTVYTLTNYGQIDPDYKKQFEQIMEKTPVYISYGGVIPYDQSVEVLKGYFALLFPTRFFTEGIPGTILDAYAAGIPVICSKWESFDDVIDDYKTGIGYPYEKYDELVAILERIQENPNLIIKMKNTCVEKAQQYLPKNALVPLLRRL